MIRTTTPTHILTFPFDPTECDEIQATYSQNDKICFQKGKEDFEINSMNKSVRYMLSQEETKSFNVYSPVSLQVKVRIGEIVMASDIKTLRVGQVLDDSLMGPSGGDDPNET